MADADHCEHGWTWSQCCPKPWPSADRTAFTHGLDHFYDPAVIPTAVPDGHTVIDGKLWRVIPTGFGYDDGSQSCRLVPVEGQADAAERVQPPPHLTPEEVQEIRDWIATPPTSHVDDLIYRALRELSEITEEVRTLRLLVAVNEASQIPDGHTRIDGKLFRLERHGDLNRYGLVRVEATDD